MWVGLRTGRWNGLEDAVFLMYVRPWALYREISTRMVVEARFFRPLSYHPETKVGDGKVCESCMCSRSPGVEYFLVV